ncbi:MAG TPA: hypothetical protein VH186_36930 [Chloroflexia bacterium]|nr:hypothetical protein [Chloroflexia bacterium]
MSIFSNYTTKIKDRLTQKEIEEDPDSLSARAFRRRVLNEDEITANLGSSLYYKGKPSPVAVYRDNGRPVIRILLRMLLVIIAPVLALGLITFVVVNTVSQNRVTQPVETESVVYDNIPVPAGVRPISRARTIGQTKFIESYIAKFLPNYVLNIKGAASYISDKSQDELLAFYKGKLVDPRPPPWQIYGTPGKAGDFYAVLYLRSLDGSRTLEGIVLQLQRVDGEVLKNDPEYYDRQAKPGEMVLILTKVFLGLK